jgi:hypothetical protein
VAEEEEEEEGVITDNVDAIEITMPTSPSPGRPHVKVVDLPHAGLPTSPSLRLGSITRAIPGLQREPIMGQAPSLDLPRASLGLRNARLPRKSHQNLHPK